MLNLSEPACRTLTIPYRTRSYFCQTFTFHKSKHASCTLPTLVWVYSPTGLQWFFSWRRTTSDKVHVTSSSLLCGRSLKSGARQTGFVSRSLHFVPTVCTRMTRVKRGTTAKPGIPAFSHLFLQISLRREAGSDRMIPTWPWWPPVFTTWGRCTTKSNVNPGALATMCLGVNANTCFNRFFSRDLPCYRY